VDRPNGDAIFSENYHTATDNRFNNTLNEHHAVSGQLHETRRETRALEMVTAQQLEEVTD
jgi:hypothetical protein